MIAITISLHRVLNINNLLISILTLGLVFAYIPGIILNYRKRTKIKHLIIQSESAGENTSKRIKIIGEPYYKRSGKGLLHRRKKKTYPQKIFMNSIG